MRDQPGSAGISRYHRASQLGPVATITTFGSGCAPMASAVGAFFVGVTFPRRAQAGSPAVMPRSADSAHEVTPRPIRSDSKERPPRWGMRADRIQVRIRAWMPVPDRLLCTRPTRPAWALEPAVLAGWTPMVSRIEVHGSVRRRATSVASPRPRLRTRPDRGATRSVAHRGSGRSEEWWSG